jgi:hypothetical protein
MFEQCHIEAARRHPEHAARAVIDKEIVRAHEAIFAADSRDRRKPGRAARELSSVAQRDPAANPRDLHVRSVAEQFAVRTALTTSFSSQPASAARVADRAARPDRESDPWDMPVVRVGVARPR